MHVTFQKMVTVTYWYAHHCNLPGSMMVRKPVKSNILKEWRPEWNEKLKFKKCSLQVPYIIIVISSTPPTFKYGSYHRYSIYMNVYSKQQQLQIVCYSVLPNNNSDLAKISIKSTQEGTCHMKFQHTSLLMGGKLYMSNTCRKGMLTNVRQSFSHVLLASPSW